MNLAAGCVVEHTAKGNLPEIAAVLSVAGSSIRIYTLNGKEAVIAAKKIVHATTRPVMSVSNREACRQSLMQTDKLRKKLASEINLAELHELLSDDIRPYSAQELSEFLFSGGDFDSSAALVRLLYADKQYFKNKAEAFVPATEAELKQAIELNARRIANEAQEKVLLDSLKRFELKGELNDELKPHLQSLKDLAAQAEDLSISKKLAAALDKTGLNAPRKMFSLLVKAGIFEEDENLLLIKYRVPTDFSAQLLSEAERLSAEAEQITGRKDLTGLKTWAIDSEGSKDRDDAFSFEKTPSGYKLFVHIADPSRVILPCSPLDKEASARSCSIYTPDKQIHMLPRVLSEKALSLAENKNCAVLTFALQFSLNGSLTDLEIFEAVIRLEKATFYDEANELLNTDEWLKSAFEFSELLKSKRKENGAILFGRQNELSISVENGEIKLSYRDKDSLTAGMTAEFMIWANYAAALFCRENQIPCLYRSQEAADDMPEMSLSFNPLTFYEALKHLKKTIVGPTPAKHSSLGLSCYTQSTSPLRRYGDLVIHRQIKSFLKSGEPFYTQETLAQAMLIADSSLAKADEIMKERERYFLYKYLKQKRLKEREVLLDCVVTELTPTDAVFYSDFFCGFRRCRRPSFNIAAGQKIKVKVNQIDLFDVIIRFDIAAEL